MKKNMLCIIETVSIILIPLLIILQIYCGWEVLKGIFSYKVKINEKNRYIIEQYLQDNSKINNLQGATEISFSHWHHTNFVIYFENGERKNFSDDKNEELIKYIKENKDNSVYILIVILFILFIFMIGTIVVVIITGKKLDNMCKVSD